MEKKNHMTNCDLQNIKCITKCDTKDLYSNNKHYKKSVPIDFQFLTTLIPRQKLQKKPYSGALIWTNIPIENRHAPTAIDLQAYVH